MWTKAKQHVIHLDGSEAFGIISHNILTRQIRKPGPDETNRLDKEVGSLLSGRVQDEKAQVPTLTPVLFNNSLNDHAETTCKFRDCTYLKDALTVAKFKPLLAGRRPLTDD